MSVIPAHRLEEHLRNIDNLADRLRVTQHQQQIDTVNLIGSIRQALDLLLRPEPPTPSRLGRRTSTLSLAMIQANRSRDEISHLSGIPRPRLDALAAGAEPEDSERVTLRQLLPEWVG